MKDSQMLEMKPNAKSAEASQPAESEFKIVGDEANEKEETLFESHPTRYYEFAQKETKYTFISRWFKYMQATEIDSREAAGMKFGFYAALIFGIVGGIKVEFFSHVSFMSFTFLQVLVSLGVFYLFCRQLDVLPFIEDDKIQWHLKLSSVSFLAGLILYIASWNYWPRQYAHFLVCSIPFIENIRESLKSTFKPKDIALLAVNYIGFFILLTIPDKSVEFSNTGLVLALAGVALLWFGFQELKAVGNSNLLSIGMVQTLVFSIFLPGFFGVVVAPPPSLVELGIILGLGVFSSFGLLLTIRSVQITKPSHCLIAASVSLAIISFVRSINIEGLLLQNIVGVIMAAGIALFILYQQQDKTTIMGYMTREPLIK